MTDSLQFREAMRAVDPDIEVGAVGVGDRGAWSDWDDKVMEGPATTSTSTSSTNTARTATCPRDDVFGLPAPRSGPTITNDVRAGFADHGIKARCADRSHRAQPRRLHDDDDEQLMTQAVNAFYLAETIGQMAANGVTIANQWNLANGRGANGTDYGLIDVADSSTQSRLLRDGAVVTLRRRARAGRRGRRSRQPWPLRRAQQRRRIDTAPRDQPVGQRVQRHDLGRSGLRAPVRSPPTSCRRHRCDSTTVTWNGSATPSIGLTESGRTVLR